MVRRKKIDKDWQRSILRLIFILPFFYYMIGNCMDDLPERDERSRKRIEYRPFLVEFDDLLNEPHSIDIYSNTGKPVIVLFPEGVVGIPTIWGGDQDCFATATGRWWVKDNNLYVRARLLNFHSCEPSLYSPNVDLMFTAMECSGQNNTCNSKLRLADGRVFSGLVGRLSNP